MPFEILKSEGEWTLRLRGVVDIFEAAQLRAAAVGALDDPAGDIVADLVEAEAVDTSTTQVLLGLKRSLLAAGRALSLRGTPAPVAETWRIMGLGDELR